MSSKDRIVVVEDDEGKRYVLTRQLRQHGFEVLEACTAAQGLALVDHTVDVVILDIKLPDMSGYEVSRRLKSDPAKKHAMILGLSAAYTSGEDRVRGLLEGADAYLVHPVDVAELLATIAALRRLRQAERDRVELEAQLRESEALNQVVTEAVTVGLLYLDAEGRCTLMNPAARELTGHAGPPEEFVLSDRLFGSTQQPRPADELASKARVHQRDGMVSTPTRRIPVRWSSIPVSGDGGMVVQLEDVREQKSAEAERELFLGVLGHDLRNPLESIRLAATMLKRCSEDERGELVGRIDRSVTNMASLIAQLLSFATVRGAGLSLQLRDADLRDVASTTIENLRLTFPDCDLHLLAHGNTSGCWDTDRLSQVFQNLLTNACEHGEPGTPIRLELRDEGSMVEARVHNFGAPISEEDQRQLFQPYRRATRRTGGLGLGLYIAHSIARAHEGTLDVTSSAREGTTFTLRLPRRGPKHDEAQPDET